MMMKRSSRRGFTLVELMIAILLTSMMGIVTYAVFDTTSDNFVEVDSLADVNERLRFSVERIRSDMQSAGANSTVDSKFDHEVKPRPATFRVAGLVTYEGWQDDRTAFQAPVATANPNVSLDGIVVMGAVDFPLSFETSGFTSATGVATIQGHHRGLARLRAVDPFNTKMVLDERFMTPASVAGFQPQWISRLLRLRDRGGFMQFVEFTGGVDPTGDLQIASDAGSSWSRLDIHIGSPNAELGPMFSGASAAADSRDAGLDDQDARDYAYDSALIDAYWYHVRRDPQDPANMQLVRERLCAPKLARDIATGTWDPADARIGGSVCSGDSQTTREIVVLTDYVVDFQIWFDCGDGTNGLVENVNWSNDWSPPDNVGTCMDDSDPKWGLARVGHLRVSLRTARERKNLRHIQFEDRTGALCDPDAPAACAGVTGEGLNLRTFDAYPTVEGAAQVVTLQSDFVLPNFVNRNATRDIDAVFNP